MHRLIVGAPAKTLVDHWNGNGLNNTRANIRVCTPTQNSWNKRVVRARSGLKGAYWDPYDYSKGRRTLKTRPWKAKIQFEGRQIFLGRYASAEEAGGAYDQAAIRYFGEFAATNKELRL
ncbi:MAG: phosphatidylinositol-bisphosphatase [Gammaproteobacteria bacterium]|nr:phosphatidylinositol-bisphosphatase [Gammaproteobacteria bacterium]